MKHFKLWLATIVAAFCCVNNVVAEDVSQANLSLLLSKSITTAQDATIEYSIRTSHGNVSYPADLEQDVYVFVDGIMVSRLNALAHAYLYDKSYFVELSPGQHEVKWMMDKGTITTNEVAVSYVGIEDTPLITVNLLEPGSLGTEILYNVDNVKDVKRLKIIGAMNDDDWRIIDMMSNNLYVLDMGEAVFTELKEEQFYHKNQGKWKLLHKVVLPEGLLTIGKSAFSAGNVVDVNIPSTITSVGTSAFTYTSITSVELPDGCLEIGESAFSGCRNLRSVKWSDEIKTIRYHTFFECRILTDLKLPSKLETVSEGAFYNCTQLDVDFREDSYLKYLEKWSFSGTAIDSLVFSDYVTNNIFSSTTGNQFEFCNQLVYAEFPVGISEFGGYNFQYCNNLKNIVLKSPTMVKGRFDSNFSKTDVVIHVPSFLVNSYKLDGYWYDFQIEGFSTSEIDYWYIANPLVLNARDRFEGNPSVRVSSSGSLKINGEAPMSIQDLTINRVQSSAGYGQIFSNCDNIVLNGDFTITHATQKNKWYFLALPFDIKVSDITFDGGSSYAIRYYDGSERAANGTGGSWKNHAATDIITAGTGFIIQTSKDETVRFHAIDNATKQYAVSTLEFVKALAPNNSSNAANKGWNLVGNPWQCYYNNHSLNFTAPITIFNENNNTYTAYSTIDDDYAIRPNMAFFVQCPDEVNSIGFPTIGRQLTSVIENQNGVNTRDEGAEKERLLIDIELSDGNQTDKTRLVVNPKASIAYETNCDASKFFAMDSNVPQIYSIDEEGNQYAINERPLANKQLLLTLVFPTDGSYTLSTPRNELGKVTLVDNETGRRTDLIEGSYTFEATAGIDATRFYLDLSESTATGIVTVKENKVTDGYYYNLAGQRVSHPVHGIYIKDGKKVLVK